MEEDDKIQVSDDPFPALEDSIKQLGLLGDSFKDLSVNVVASFDVNLAELSHQCPIKISLQTF